MKKINMKRIMFSLLSVIMLITMALPAAATPVLAGEDGAANVTAGSENVISVDCIVISPDAALIKAGGEENQSYSAEAFDARDNGLGDVTQDTKFTIQPEAGGSWEGNTYISGEPGDWVVTGTYISGEADTANLYILETAAYPGGSLVSPHRASVSSGTKKPAKLTPVVAASIGDHDITFVSHTFDGTYSTWTYSVTSGSSPALSHWAISWCDETAIEDVSETPWEYGTDPNTGITGIKFDKGYSGGETRTVWFRLEGDHAEGLVKVGTKAGGNIAHGWVTGPLCGPPHLETAKSATDACINGEAEITLEVTGAGEPVPLPLDIMLIIDRSGSMEGAKLAAAKSAATTFVNLLDPANDRSGLVSFSYRDCLKWFLFWCIEWGPWYAILDQGLTPIQSDVTTAIAGLTADGNTGIGDGINMATDELMGNGRVRPPVVYAEILLSDGRNNVGADPIDAAYDAAGNNIVIYAIGLGPDVDAALMQNIADITGGTYYYAPDASDLEHIYEEIAGELSNIAGTNVVVTEVLPTGVNYVDGSASPPPSSWSGQTLTWNLGIISIGVTETITFDVTFDGTISPGSLVIDVYPDTRVDYTNYESLPAFAVFPLTEITVFEAPTASITPDPAIVCVGVNLQLHGNPSGGSGTYTTHSWTGDGAAHLLDPNVQNPIFNSGTADTYDLTYTVTDSNGCVGSDDIQVTVELCLCTLTVTSTGCCDIQVGSLGTVSAGTSNTFTVPCGTDVTLTADDSDVCCDFDNWTGDATGTDNPVTIHIDGNKSVTGHCTGTGPFSLTVTSDGCCPIDVSGAATGTVPAGESRDYTVSCGSVINVSADDSGACCVFDSWSDNGAQAHDITVTADQTVTATCSPTGSVTLTVTSDGCCPIDVSGAATGTVPAGESRDYTVSCGSVINVSADDSGACCVFDSWSDNGAQAHDITVTADQTVTATCSPTGSVTLTVTSDGCCPVKADGAVVTTPYTHDYACGTDVEIEAVDGVCCTFDNWTVDGVSQGTTNPISVTMTADHDATATCTAPEGPTATASNDGPYHLGDTINLTGGPAGMASYNWTGPDGWTSSDQNPTRANATAAMAGAYTLTVTDPNGCTDYDTTDVVIIGVPGITVDKSVDKPVIHSGELVTYTIVVTNTGGCDLTVDVVDDVLGTIATGVPLASGASRTYNPTANPTATVTNTVTATGTDSDWRNGIRQR